MPGPKRPDDGDSEPPRSRSPRTRPLLRPRYLQPEPSPPDAPPSGPPPPVPVHYAADDAATLADDSPPGGADSMDSDEITIRELAEEARRLRAERGPAKPTTASTRAHAAVNTLPAPREDHENSESECPAEDDEIDENPFDTSSRPEDDLAAATATPSLFMDAWWNWEKQVPLLICISALYRYMQCIFYICQAFYHHLSDIRYGGTLRVPASWQPHINDEALCQFCSGTGASPTTPTSPTKQCRLGPKSQGAGSIRCLRTPLLLLLLIAWIPAACAGTDARVDSDSRPVSGALRGELLGGSTACTTTFPAPCSGRQRIRKRAFARALRRARSSQDGTTVYRGRTLRAPQHSDPHPKPNRPSATTASSPTTRQRSRLRTFSLNVGGLDATTFDCLMAWLPKAPYDIIALQEIHHGLGKESSHWSSAGWTFITSVDPSSRFQGLATLVRQDFQGDAEIHHKEIKPGRLLHVRLARPEYHIDVVNFYQQAYQPDSAGHNLSKRHSLWDSLNATIQQLARRNMLVLLGDFNCTPIYVAGHIGCSMSSAELYSDAAEFTTILEANQLVVLNTWSRRRLLPTFTGPRHQSIIDFIITRQGHADAVARRALPQRGFTLSPWRQGGKHHPVEATLPLHPGWQRASPRSSTQPKRSYDNLALTAAVRDRTPQYDALREAFRSKLAAAQTSDLQQINDILLDLVCRLFPRAPPQPQLRAWQTSEVQTSVADMWRARRRMQRPADHPPGSFRACFQAWRRHQEFQKAYKALRKRGREARKAVLENYLEQAQTAVERGDHGLLHRIIRQMAPKTRHAQVRIHGKQGEMLTYQQEQQAIVEHFETLFLSRQSGCTLSAARPSAHYEVSPLMFQQALDSLKMGKAVPPGSAPTSAVRACSDMISTIAAPQAETCLNGAETPSLWADCTLALIPKPHKSGKRPENLRPLGLQDTGAKAYAKVLKQLLLREVSSTIAALPLFAYVPGKSTDTAISRVTAHCRQVRSMHEGQQATVHTRRAQIKQKVAIGGIQLAIDLSTAFDRVPRERLYQALIWAGASETLARTIIDLHEVCKYSINHRGRHSHINMRRGVRQGCTLAPLLWVVYSAYVADHLGQELSHTWVSQHLTLYADDTHASWLVNSLGDLRSALQAIPVIFSVYQRFGMQVNPQKSGIILGVKGLLGKSTLAPHVHGPPDARRLVLGPPHQQLIIPIKDSLTYLGVSISYGGFEDITLNYRLDVARNTRGRLIKILHARRYLSVRKRLQLYTLCVRTAALYGLMPVGLTAAGLRRLHTFEVKHVRAISRSPVHITREPTEALYKRLGLIQPGDYLLKLLKQRTRTLTKLQDLAVAQFQQRIEELKQHLAALRHGLQEVTATQAFACPTCGQYFDTLPGMRSHHTKTHGWRLQGERPALQSAAGPQPEPALQFAAGLTAEGATENALLAPFELPEVQALLSTNQWKDKDTLDPAKPVERHPVGDTDVVSCISSALCYTTGVPCDSSGLNQPIMAHQEETFGPQDPMTRGQLAAEEVRDILGEAVATMQPHPREDVDMPAAPTLGKRTEDQQIRPTKFSKPAGKGQGQGQSPTKGPADDKQNNPSPPASSWQNPRGWKDQQLQRRQGQGWKQQEWDDEWYHHSEVKELRQMVEALQEHVRLLARMALRHEDELSQARTERDFLFTFEPPTTEADSNMVNMLGLMFKMAVLWKEKKEKGEVDSSLRLVLFLGLLRQWTKQITTNLEQPEDLEQLAKLKLLRQKDAGQGMEWPYLRWNQERQMLEESQTPALDHKELMTALATLESSITAPGALLRFHATRRLVEQHQSPVTFLVTIGMRDPKSLLCHRALCSLCFNASSQLLKFRVRPARMERQPLARVLAEQFPPPTEHPMGRGRSYRKPPSNRPSPAREMPPKHPAVPIAKEGDQTGQQEEPTS
ncbi:unnamed protein product [Symbiodinium sp. CCMP2592]|nr:unnamed protein product [Symbiodinium sp. CCMP2592]